jgi:hypothetical protein
MSIIVDRQDGLSSSTAFKGPCRAATEVNIVLEGLQTIDGVLLEEGNRVLVAQQTDARDNGIYVADTGPWRRAKDFSRTDDVIKGTRVTITDGESYARVTFQVTTANPIVVGTTEINFAVVESRSTETFDVATYVFATDSYHPEEASGYIRVSGHTIAGDGGSSLWRMMDEDEDDLPGQMVVTLSDSTEVRYGYVPEGAINVSAFGADGTGAADGHAAIQNAIDFAVNWVSPAQQQCIHLTGSGQYVVSDTLVIEKSNDSDSCDIVFAIGGIIASDSFPLNKPILQISRNAFGCIVEKNVIDCNFRASGILAEAGPSQGFLAKIDKNTIIRMSQNLYSYGVHVGTNPFDVEPGHTLQIWELAVFSGGASGHIARINGDKIYVVALNRNGDNEMPGIGETITGSLGGEGVTLTLRNTGTNMTTVSNNYIHGLVRGDGEDFWDPTKNLAVGLWGAGNDTKVFGNTISRCGGTNRPSVRVDGWHWLIEGNHTFPVANWEDGTGNWYTNYEVWYGNNTWVANYIDNGSIDFMNPASAECMIGPNLFTKNDHLISDNDAPIRIFADKVNADFTEGDLLNIGPVIYGGQGHDDFTSLIKYTEQGGNTFLNQLSRVKLGNQAIISSQTRVYASLRGTHIPVQMLTTESTSRIGFDNANRVADDPAQFGASGDNPAIWRDNVAVYEHTATGHDMKGVALFNAPWKTVQMSENVTLTNANDRTLYINNTANNYTITLSAACTPGVTFRAFRRSTGTLDIAPAAGAEINNAGSSVAVLAGRGVEAFCGFGSGANAEFEVR